MSTESQKPDGEKATPTRPLSQRGNECLSYTPENGLRMLARMMAEAHLEELGNEARSMRPGYMRELFITKIQISIDCLDLNLPTVRQQLHSLIDEALESANQVDREGTGLNQPFQSFKKDGFSIRFRR